METHFTEIQLEYFKVPHYHDLFRIGLISLTEELKI
jgi:hypothetical protein